MNINKYKTKPESVVEKDIEDEINTNTLSKKMKYHVKKTGYQWLHGKIKNITKKIY